MSKLNKLLILALGLQVLMILGMRLDDDRTHVVQPVTVLEKLDADQVTKVQVFGAPQEKDGPPQNSVTLSKVNGKWGVADADDYPVDGKKVEDFLKSLAKLRSRTTVLTKATYHDKLQVSDKKYVRKIVLTAGAEERTLFVGSSPSFKNVHVRLAGKDEVLLVSDFASSDAGDRAWSWVDRTYVKYGDDQVWKVKVQNKKGSVDLERDPAGKQWAALGVNKPLDESAVSELVRKASTINVESPVGKALKPEYGLDNPLATVTLITGTSTIAGAPPPSTETVTVKIGAKIEAENQYYVKASTKEHVVRVAGWSVEPLLEKSKDDLLEKAK